MKIADINVGSRVRKESGDIQALADSIARHGLLHPVVVTKDGLLVAGARRLEAAAKLGWEGVPVTIVSVDDLLSAERDENEVRKDFTPTEAVAIGRLIEEQHRAKLAAIAPLQRAHASRLGVMARAGTTEEPLPSNEGDGHTAALGPAIAIAAKAVGMSETTYHRAKQVVVAAESNPEAFGDLPARMDEGAAVATVHGELVRRGGSKRKSEAPAPRHAVHRKTPLPRPNLAVERAIAALGGICLGLEEINPDELDPEKTAVWSAALKNSASILSRLARRMVNGKA